MKMIGNKTKNVMFVRLNYLYKNIIVGVVDFKYVVNALKKESIIKDHVIYVF